MSADIPTGYKDVDPRTARRVPLWHVLDGDGPLFDGDPPFTHEVVATIADQGFLLERVTGLGTHTGTHVSAPAHFVPDGPLLSGLGEGWALMPLVVIDVRAGAGARGGDLVVGRPDAERFEDEHGPIPRGACVLLLTGFAERWADGTRRYHDPAPGFSADLVAWLFDVREIRAVGSDTFGPDASADTSWTASSAALHRGGITIENVGPGLALMRPFGDWVAVNGPRPGFSGFPVGITGFTVPEVRGGDRPDPDTRRSGRVAYP
ncbi:MAG: hypothetical protein QG622_3697 [Actinomycetota bacterium]|nr:hypothetical protein [Actinomycetota bacterium]